MLEVLKPADPRAIDIHDRCAQALPIVPRGLGSNRVLELIETLLTRPSLTLLEVISQEVKPAGLFGVDDPRLDRMQGQTRLRGPLPHLLQGPFGFRLAPAQDHKVSSARESHPHALAEPYVNVSAHTAPTVEPRRTPICQ